MKFFFTSLLTFVLCSCQSLTSKNNDQGSSAKASPEVPKRFIAVKDFKNLESTRIEDFKLAATEVGSTMPTHLFFGYLDQIGTDVIFVPTENIPYLEGRLYGWALKYAVKKPLDEKTMPLVSEEMTLPESPRVLRVNQETTQIKNNGKLIITKMPLKPNENWTFNFWEITAEDPEGIYNFTIRLKDQVLIKKPITLKKD